MDTFSESQIQPELATIPEACKAINAGRSYLYAEINSGRLKAVKMGRKTMIPYSAIQEWVANLAPYKSKNGEKKNDA